jgi:chemotaxis protein MotB
VTETAEIFDFEDDGLLEECEPCKKFAPIWMTTFADMSILLMALFAILYSYANQDEQERALMMGSLNKAFGAVVIMPSLDIPIAETIVISEIQSVNKNLKTLSDEELDALSVAESIATLNESLAEEIRQGQVVIRTAQNKVIVELQSFSEKDAKTDNYYLTQSVLDISEKVLVAQAKTSTEIEVRKQDLASLEAIKQRRIDSAKKRYSDMTAEFSDEVQRGVMELILQEENLTIRLPGEGAFVSGSAKVQSNFKELLLKIGERLSVSKGKIRIEGHTDNVKIAFSDQFKSNWDLSSARSSSVASVFIKENGIAIDRLVVAGYADSVPLESNETGTGRSKNRRIEVIIRGD